MPAPLIVPIVAGAVKGVCWICGAIAASYCVKKAHDAYENSQKTKRDKYGLKSKAIDVANEDNKKAQEESTEWKKKLEAEEERVKKLEKSLEEAKSKSNRTDLSEEEKSATKRLIISLQQELDQANANKKNILDHLKKLGERIAKNNETINNAGLNPDDKHWVWDFLTLENIMIMGGCYVMYKLVKDDK